MKDFLLVAGFLVFWITLNRWILPWFGIQTCMSGGCCSIPTIRTCPVESTSTIDRQERNSVESQVDVTKDKEIQTDSLPSISNTRF